MIYLLILIAAIIVGVYFYRNNKAKVDPVLDKAAEVVEEVKDKV